MALIKAGRRERITTTAMTQWMRWLIFGISDPRE
jgi:hypothetical protein